MDQEAPLFWDLLHFAISMSPLRPAAVSCLRWLAAGLLAAALAAGGACNNSPPTSPHSGAEQTESEPAGPFFRDVTADSGVQAVYRNGEEAGLYAILEALGGGVALLDYDGDGLLDVFVPGGGTFAGQEIRGQPCKLFKNLGGFKFKDV